VFRSIQGQRLRKRVPEHRFHLVHCARFERAHRGRFGDNYLVRYVLGFYWDGSLTWTDLIRHVYMVIAAIVTLLLCAISVAFLPEHFVCISILL